MHTPCTHHAHTVLHCNKKSTLKHKAEQFAHVCNPANLSMYYNSRVSAAGTRACWAAVGGACGVDVECAVVLAAAQNKEQTPSAGLHCL